AGLVRLPDGSNGGQVYGVAALRGIGLTTRPIIGEQAFPSAPELADEDKEGALIGSALSAVWGVGGLRRFAQRG
ncbi:Na(+)/H(+) antiporter NhaA, partial [Pseudomonas syringae]|uniref:Na+/H+ antiporter NhaA n=1 Tax=Pseudomonas syringae TaxID=317 RepID=UPI001F2611EF